MHRILTILALTCLLLPAADMPQTRWDSAQNGRAKLATILAQPTRGTTEQSAASALIAKYNLTAINVATFGRFANAVGDNSAAISASSKSLTSATGPWSSSDVGKAIDVAGAGAAGGTLRTTIAAFVSSGAVTLTDAASTTVTPSTTSAAGLCVWGDLAGIAIGPTPLSDGAGTLTYPGISTATVAVAGSTTPRTVAERAADFVSVRDYGAVGDGSTDDTAAIQRAVDAYYNVFVPPGAYKIVGDGIQLRTGSRIYGAGPQSILRKSADTNAYILYASSKTDIAIESLTVDGNRSTAADYTNSKFCIYLSDCSRCLVSGVTCMKSLSDGIVLEYGANNRVEGCVVHNCNKQGIYLSGAEDSAVVGCVSYACGSNSTGGGIAAACTWNSSISGNVCHDNVQSDIILSRGSRFVSVVGNTLGGNLSGQAPLSIYVLGEPMGGTLHGVNYGAGSTYYGASDCTISGNTVFADMRLELLNDSIVTGNTVNDANDIGIWLTGCTRVSVTGNRVSNWTNYGIQLSSSAKNGTTATSECTVSGNALYKSGGTAASALSKSGTGHVYGSNTLNGSPLETGGTFTPALATDATQPTVTYTEQLGSYAIMGDLVFVRCRITVNTVTATGSGTLLVSGLPFQSLVADQAFLTVSRLQNTQNPLTLTSLGLGVNSSSAAFYYTPTSTGSASAMAASDAVKAGFTFTASGCYRIVTP